MADRLSSQHFVQDVIGNPRAQETLTAKFSYGGIGKDLENEPVQIHLSLCTGWKSVGRSVTDNDGRTAAKVQLPSQPGRYRVAQSVDGDGSYAQAQLTVAPAGTSFVVFDLDGTLTVRDAEITAEVLDEYFGRVYDGEYTPSSYGSAPELTQAWADKGYLLVYLTGRPYWLLDHTRRWLDDHGFAPGTIHTTDRHPEVLPTRAGVGQFKAKYLRSLTARGYVLHAAYGNAKTDIFAYDQAGLNKHRTFVIGPNRGHQNTQPIGRDYSRHMHWVDKHEAARQPFSSPAG